MCIFTTESYLQVPDHVLCHCRSHVTMRCILIELEFGRMSLPAPDVLELGAYTWSG